MQSWELWKELALLSADDAVGVLAAMRRIGRNHMPSMLSGMIGLRQDPEHHPEGDVWTHTLLTVKAALVIAERDDLNDFGRITLFFAALLHDTGKIWNTFDMDGYRITAHDHDESSATLASNFFYEIDAPQWVKDAVVPLVSEHMAHMRERSDKGLRRLNRRLGIATLEQLLRLIEADYSARPPLPPGLPERAVALRDHAVELGLIE